MFRLAKFEENKEAYKDILANNTDYNQQFKWKYLKQFQDNWDILADDFQAMYDASVADELVEKFWPERHFQPKKAMLQLISFNPKQGRHIFRELFNEELDYFIRMDRFEFDCDQLLKHYKKNHAEIITHDHDEHRMISMYMALRFPAEFSFYDYQTFKDMMEKMESPNIPSPQEIGRYYKILGIMDKMLRKDEDLLNLHKKVLGKNFYDKPNLLLAQDFCWCCTQEELV